MSYETREADENVEVINSDTSEVVAVHEPPDAKEKAEAQVQLLHEIERELDAAEDQGSHHGDE